MGGEGAPLAPFFHHNPNRRMVIPRKIPRIPAAAKRAGATEFKRLGPDKFALSFNWDADVIDPNHPGCGQDVVDALRKTWKDCAKIDWTGRQLDAIIVEFID
mgnify:CR=1 FL=1